MIIIVGIYFIFRQDSCFKLAHQFLKSMLTVYLYVPLCNRNEMGKVNDQNCLVPRMFKVIDQNCIVPRM